MPKDTIRDDAGQFDVRVGWQADHHVQVGVETAKGHSLVTVLYGSPPQLDAIARAVVTAVADCQPLSDQGDVEQLGRAILDVIEGHPDPYRSYIGAWATLTREGCNALIRSVRRARDSAYGADA